MTTEQAMITMDFLISLQKGEVFYFDENTPSFLIKEAILRGYEIMMQKKTHKCVEGNRRFPGSETLGKGEFGNGYGDGNGDGNEKIISLNICGAIHYHNQTPEGSLTTRVDVIFYYTNYILNCGVGLGSGRRGNGNGGYNYPDSKGDGFYEEYTLEALGYYLDEGDEECPS